MWSVRCLWLLPLTWPALFQRAVHTLTPTFIWPLICLIEFLNAFPLLFRWNLGECFLFRFECQWHAISTSTSTRALAGTLLLPLCTPVSQVSGLGWGVFSWLVWVDRPTLFSALSNYAPKYVDGHVVSRMPECQFYMSFLITVSIVCSEHYSPIPSHRIPSRPGKTAA